MYEFAAKYEFGRRFDFSIQLSFFDFSILCRVKSRGLIKQGKEQEQKYDKETKQC